MSFEPKTLHHVYCGLICFAAERRKHTGRYPRQRGQAVRVLMHTENPSSLSL